MSDLHEERIPGEKMTMGNRKKQGGTRLLLKASEAANALAISERKLWELTNRNEIPSIRIGRAVRYRIEDLEEFVATCSSPPVQ